MKKSISAKYDQLWMMAGGCQNKNVNFEIPCNSDEKPIELRPSNKCREYRRRAAVLESMRTQIHSLAQGLLPMRQRPDNKNYIRQSGGGRKPKDARLVFEAIVYVLRTGCQWKAIPAERFGSANAIHARFLEWEKAVFFEALWKACLAEYEELEGIAWRWQSIDGVTMKAPLAQEAVGPNPTDRGKKWTQTPSVGGRTWRPVVVRRNRSQSS